MANDIDLVKMFSELTPDQARDLTQRIKSAVQAEYLKVKGGDVPAIVQQEPVKASEGSHNQAQHEQRLQHG
jgi:hypothetical protein